MEEVGLQAETSLSKFSYALDQLEHTLRPVLKAIDELRASGNEDDLDPMSRARMHISLCYAVNALFCMYLRTQGVDPATHPISDEIGRVQEAFMRMRKVEAGLSVDHQPAPDRDRRRHIVNAKKGAEKLASLVFPEEVDLLNAIRGKKRKRKAAEDGKEKKRRTEEKPSALPDDSEVDTGDEDENTTRCESRQKEGDALPSEQGKLHLSKVTKQNEYAPRGQGASQVHNIADASSSEKLGAEAHEASAKQKQEKTKSKEKTISGKKKKKKGKSKGKDSGVDSDKKSKDKKKKKDKDRTPKESRRSEEKRKRKKRAEKGNSPLAE